MSSLPQRLLQAAAMYLPYLPLVLITRYLLQNLLCYARHRLKSDLHAIPGPPLPIWKLYSIGHNLFSIVMSADSFDTAALFNSWRSEYGPVYQLRSLLGERVVIIMSEQGLRAVNITRPSSFVRSTIARNFLAPFVGENGILLAEGARHARLRKAVAPAMHHEALVSVGEVFLEQGRLLAERCSRYGEKGEDILRDVRIGTFAVIFQTCFGKHGAPEDEVARLQEAYLESFLEPPWHLMLSAILQQMFWFVDPSRFTWRKDLKTYIKNTISALCADGTARSEGETRLLSLMVDENTKTSITEQEMVETVLSFVAAGQATTSLAVCWALYLLAREQRWQEQVVKELESWSEESGLDSLDRLPVFNRVIRECLRLYPPAYFTSRVCTKPVELEGFTIPAGTNARIPILALQRNEEIWGPDVNEFNPDRFLCDGETARTKMFWCVFMFGPRSCIGQRFAVLEIKAFLAQVLSRLVVYVKPLDDPSPSSKGAFSTPVGMKLYFRARELA